MKRFTVPCDFNGVKHPFHVYIGEPHPKKHPLQFQAWWLSSERGGTIPQDVMDSFEKLFKISQENNVSFEDLCVYALGTASEENAVAAPQEASVDDATSAAPIDTPGMEEEEEDPFAVPTTEQAQAQRAQEAQEAKQETVPQPAPQPAAQPTAQPTAQPAAQPTAATQQAAPRDEFGNRAPSAAPQETAPAPQETVPQPAPQQAAPAPQETVPQPAPQQAAPQPAPQQAAPHDPFAQPTQPAPASTASANESPFAQDPMASEAIPAPKKYEDE